MSGLQIRDVRKAYGKHDILKGINLTVNHGEFVILVGSSGCGKSTLLNMIAGLEDIEHGEIHIGSRRVNDLSPKDRDIAMVFQSYALYPGMTVQKNIEFALEMRKVPKEEREAVVKRVAKTLQIDHLLDRRPSQLSGGQRQRVAMGRALARNPAIFLFDEPLSNLDAKLRVEMRSEIKQLHQRVGATIVYVTHDQVEAMTLGDRIAVMREGRVLQYGTPEEIYNQPSTLYVAGFIGSPSMNFIPVTLQEIDGQWTCDFVTSVGDRKLVVGPVRDRQWDGKQVILGIRPEHFHEARSLSEDHLPLPIDRVEPTGADTYIYGSVNGATVAARLLPRQMKHGTSRLSLQFDLPSLSFFDPQTELRITP
ncbi:ABC transporter ATP-binding protein [Leeia aquatica]|uniref:sn-glycerol-3-phosphate ABC transporter ATP-binding protein UgpC n=1 Tax=Leeia aquatica TaxID=2725557 RepID=A0A847S3N4_9NEIS|nr:sn-glycerol-3-phosphate ABC transporter ATP-binding protein UgpC [Leeia aquatica]NLR74413.1 sn-glycerol-3-phosphate ABC transporter ATP-binding protein UgpC [Leeia aquatica]